MAEITLGGKTLTRPAEVVQRLSLMLWGSSGSGKTTLASTAPGLKLWINFDPDGTNALNNRDDIIVLDLSNEPNNIVMKFRNENPLNLKKFFEDNPDVETVVFDSLTTFGEKALVHGVEAAKTTAKGKYATLEDPGFAGYGNKNTWTHACVRELLKITGQYNKHMIFIAHEDKPVMNDSGVVLYISIMLGSSLNEQLPVKISEIWNLTDTGKERRLAIRNCRGRKPMKSRMFVTSGEPEFTLNYNADELSGDGIEQWYEKWKKNGGKKIEIPK